jgi:hypothetical protein
MAPLTFRNARGRNGLIGALIADALTENGW